MREKKCIPISISISIDIIHICCHRYKYISIYRNLYLSTSTYLTLCQSKCLSTYLHTYPPTYLSICLPVNLSIFLLTYLFIYSSLSIYLFIHLCIYLSISISANLSIYLLIYLLIYLPTSIYIPKKSLNTFSIFILSNALLYSKNAVLRMLWKSQVNIWYNFVKVNERVSSSDESCDPSALNAVKCDYIHMQVNTGIYALYIWVRVHLY